MTYREVPKDRILIFGATPAFKGWRDHFTKDSTIHPAKMNLNLLRWILQKYTKAGNTILDPMAGTGSTAILASLLGRHGVAVECEPQFCKMINENISRSKIHTSLKTKGSMTCLQGDARKLSSLLEKSDIIVTSPPYSDSNIGGDPDDKRLKRLQKAIDRGDKISDRNKAWLKARLKGKQEGIQFDRQRGYHGGPENIANLKHGDINSIITSPPYGNRLSDTAVHDGDRARMGYRQTVDIVLTSPPYEKACLDGKDPEARRKRLEEAGYNPKDFLGGHSRNVILKGYRKIDTVITSPPYGSDNANLMGRTDKSAKSILATTGVKSVPLAKDNIGNLEDETYLKAMLDVYRECHKVLNPGGIMILVTKNFIRKKQVIRLDEETIKLCEEAGFNLLDHWYFKLPTKSFWRQLYRKKYPEVPDIIFEDVLIFEKI